MPDQDDALVPRLRSSLAAVDIPGFFNTVEQALALYIQTEGTPEGVRPTFVHGFPKERLTQTDQALDLITFRVKMAEMSPTMKDGSKPRSPRLREEKPDPLRVGYNVKIYGWWEDVLVEFSCWSQSNLRADLLTAWFHKFLMQYAFAYKFLEARGVSQFRFVSREDDDFDPSDDGQEVYRRRLSYAFRLEYLSYKIQKTLDNVTVNVGIDLTLGTTDNDSNTTPDLIQIDTIELPSLQ